MTFGEKKKSVFDVVGFTSRKSLSIKLKVGRMEVATWLPDTFFPLMLNKENENTYQKRCFYKLTSEMQPDTAERGLGQGLGDLESVLTQIQIACITFPPGVPTSSCTCPMKELKKINFTGHFQF